VLAVAAALAPGSGAHLRRPEEPAFAPAPPPAAAAWRSDRVAQPSLCAGTETSSPYPWPTEYPWPIAPFHEQHPIRGYFGDPRTVFRDATDPQLGAFSFHNGVDIDAPEGTAVYPVVSGDVTEVRVNEVVVASEAGRRIFQYWHISPLVVVGQHVDAERSLLGLVQAPARHIHLTEIVDGVVQNPLQPHHLTPYADATAPTVDGLYLRSADGRELNPEAVTGTIELIARAQDIPALPVPEPWTGLPVGPALVGFQVTTPDGREVLPEQTPADFMVTEPGNRDFFDVYAPGTFQNVPAVGKHLYRGTPGEYLYELTPARLDTASLRPGRYVVTVTAEDTCGNTGTLREPITVLPQRPGAEAGRLRFAGWPSGLRRGWTVVIASLASRRAGAAREAARMATAAGLERVGILASSRFAGLHRGSLLVVAGLYASPEDAEDARVRDARLYPRAVVRELVRRATRAGRAGRHRGPARRATA
jgi:hypothetical protein